LVKDDEDEAGDCDNDNKCNGVDNEVCKPAVLKKWPKQTKRKRSLVRFNFELNSLFDFICILPNVSFRNFNRTLSLFPTL